MKKLLSLPPNLVGSFHEITELPRSEWFCTNDPVGKKLGSGGGTTWLLRAAYEDYKAQNADAMSFDEWLAADKRLLLHAGGQSRRLPSYAPSGKILTPLPVFRWERGQSLNQNLLSLQVPLYKRIMDIAPRGLNTMIVSGDVYIRSTEPLQPIPEDADIVCYGLWLGPEIAKDHGVFVSTREKPTELKCMLQKPSVETLSSLLTDHFYLTDIGVWILSDRAVKVLMQRSTNGTDIATGEVVNYDMYGEFGCALGYEPGVKDEAVNTLKTVILPLPGGEFYHFGTSHELLSSMLAIQNIVNDQREIMHHDRKPHPSIFVQNTELKPKWTQQNRNEWVENAYVGENWTLTQDNIVTGVPENDWTLTLSEGQCVDIVPIGADSWAVRPYGFNDKFRGDLADVEYLGRPFAEWAAERGIDLNAIEGRHDLQAARIFPVVDNTDDMGIVLRWMLGESTLAEGKAIWEKAKRMSADEISAEANLRRLVDQRTKLRLKNLPMIAKNWQHSVFYQSDLQTVAHEYGKYDVALPNALPESASLLTRTCDAMFRSEAERQRTNGGTQSSEQAKKYEAAAFSLLREGLTTEALRVKQRPQLSVYADQIVWGRSPVRIDIAGGWTDTPPFCLMEGGNVVNLAINLNGQPPLQTYVKPCAEPHIILRSIDLGASEVITTYEELSAYNTVGSPFSIPKAALSLAGFLPRFCKDSYRSLEEQLRAFGCGIEVTLLSAIPAGSGLGTSSLLASTVLGALSDFCGLGWDKTEIGHRTLVLEQLLTTGGGWQDQYGGLLPGIKLLQTERGFSQSPDVRYLPGDLFQQPDYRECHLLYYTGITRTAKTILAEIVRRMFLNEHDELLQLREMKAHALEMFDAIQRLDFERMGRLVGKTWQQNQLLDAGTNPPAVEALTKQIDDLCLGYKLPGAGGGGYLYMVAKDVEAAARIRCILNENRPNDKARFVEMSLCKNGFQVSRS